MKLSEAKYYRSLLEKAKDTLAQEQADAYKNAYEAFFDGLKYVGDPNKPIPFHSPMVVKPNIYYTRNGNLYVSMYNGICTDDNFNDAMMEM